MDTEARKQLLLTRIALERAQWTHEIDELQRLASPKRFLLAAMRAAFGPAWLAGLLGRSIARVGAAGQPGLAGRLVQVLLLLRRHPVLWPMLAGAVPWVRQRGRVGWALLLLPVAAGIAAAVGAVITKRRATSTAID